MIAPLAIKVFKNNPNAKIPTKAHPEDSGWDLYNLDAFNIRDGETKIISTGIQIELPQGFDAQIRARSSMAMKSIIVVNDPGTIDNGYRGEIRVILHKLFNPRGAETVTFDQFSKIAQLVISRVESTILYDCSDEEMSKSSRGDKGLGSSGK